MKLNDVPAAGNGVEAFDILRYNAVQKASFLQICKSSMPGIRLDSLEESIELELEAPTRNRVFQKVVDVRHLLHVIFLPQATWIAISRHSAFGADASASERYNLARRQDSGSSVNFSICDFWQRRGSEALTLLTFIRSHGSSSLNQPSSSCCSPIQGPPVQKASSRCPGHWLQSARDPKKQPPPF